MQHVITKGLLQQLTGHQRRELYIMIIAIASSDLEPKLLYIANQLNIIISYYYNQ